MRVVCTDSERHGDHKFRAVNEAAEDRRRKLVELLKPLQDRLTLLHQATETVTLQLPTSSYRLGRQRTTSSSRLKSFTRRRED